MLLLAILYLNRTKIAMKMRDFKAFQSDCCFLVLEMELEAIETESAKKPYFGEGEFVLQKNATLYYIVLHF